MSANRRWLRFLTNLAAAEAAGAAAFIAVTVLLNMTGNGITTSFAAAGIVCLWTLPVYEHLQRALRAHRRTLSRDAILRRFPETPESAYAEHPAAPGSGGQEG